MGGGAGAGGAAGSGGVGGRGSGGVGGGMVPSSFTNYTLSLDDNVSAPADVVVADISLLPRFTLSGQVLDADGISVAAARVSGSSDNADVGAFHFQSSFTNVVTDAAGRFQVPVFAGTFGVAFSPDPLSGLAPFAISEIAVTRTLTIGVSVQFLSESTSSPAVVPGGSLTTNLEGDGATAADPVETSVLTPDGGLVAIQESPITETPPTGFSFLTQQINITAPPATPAAPLVLRFNMDGSRLPPGEDETTIQMFRNATLVPQCTGAPGVASPDPCVSSRSRDGDDVVLIVLTSAASHWNFGVAVRADADADGVLDSADNCPMAPNAEQVDQDHDGLGDACDLCPIDAANDADGDGLCADRDACPADNPGPIDADGDGCPDGLSISISDTRANERNSGKSDLVFTVALSAPAAHAVTVAFATVDGTAEAGVDYKATSGTLKFAPRTVSKTIRVQVMGDKVFEPDETFSVRLSAPVGATVRRGEATGTIVNDDAMPPSITISDASVVEGQRGNQAMIFQVTLSTATADPVHVAFATNDGTGAGSAKAPADYVERSGKLTFSPGTTSQTINVHVKGDTAVEQNEIFTIRLSDPVNATLARASAVGTIQNDD